MTNVPQIKNMLCYTRTFVLPVPPQVMQFTEYSFNRLAKLV